MRNYNLSFIDDADLFNHVKEIIEKYRFRITLKEFNKNIVDPIKLTFDKKVYRKTTKEIINLEIIRQFDKSNNNNIGYFHQNIFKYIRQKGSNEAKWIVPDKGFDVVNKIDKVFVEMKNKHNTMNSSSSQKTYMRMQSQIITDKESKCFLVEVIAGKTQNINWVISLDGNKTSHPNIRKVSIDKFYEIVTNIKDSFKQLIEILPIVIDDVIRNSPKDIIENKVFEELEVRDQNILKSLYLLSFQEYEGFDDFDIQL
ncbi:MAG: Eco47II family restriction endonuclease [Spiroplasma sp.]|nr:Eco47II family restriction endonuclease [Mycoplasmatales bacterium]